MASEMMAQTRPHTVASKASRSDEDSAVTSFLPKATMPGPNGMSVPIKPSSGAILDMVSVQANLKR